MKTQEEYAHEIDEIVRRDVESCQSDWFIIDKEIFLAHSAIPRNLLSMIRFQKKMNFMKVLRMKKKLKKNPANGI